jgi:hypothetical protein
MERNRTMTVARQLGQAVLLLALLGCVARLLAVTIANKDLQCRRHRRRPSDLDTRPMRRWRPPRRAYRTTALPGRYASVQAATDAALEAAQAHLVYEEP